MTTLDDINAERLVRLIRVQKQRIQELKARVAFLERDALAAEQDHTDRRMELAILQTDYADLTRRYDLIMQRSR